MQPSSPSLTFIRAWRKTLAILLNCPTYSVELNQGYYSQDSLHLAKGFHKYFNEPESKMIRGIMDLQRDIKSLGISTLGLRENGIVFAYFSRCDMNGYCFWHCPVLIPNSVLTSFMEIPLHGLLES